MSIRVGIGYDCHPFAADRRLVLGGVEIAHERGLAGHSDADVLTHAVVDALLGAAALGDLGEHFPEADERYRDADSLQLLARVVELLTSRGLVVGNVDATVIVEAPRISPYRDRMRESLATALGVEAARVSVKATTGEGMGFIGRGEGAAALAVATVEADR
ncbi:MAG TPA: 2-C-methyl-D-erythritol 2,4-cyclodiphosphate synthase [Solirubrobacteraceae bacterium]|nr:2-C-methyl-D-erythritol 2,4-cyclodiphosphate synthase [Solirubrobacteraceae bacterium]